MTFSGDADILWHTALALARHAEQRRKGQGTLPPLLFFTDPDRTPEPWRVVQNLPAGAAVVYRAFSRPEAETVGMKLRQACDQAGCLLLVGKDEGLAHTVKADGLHLPETDMQRAAELRHAHPDWLITCALHKELTDRDSHGIDAFVVSPVFPAGGASALKPDLGIDAFKRLIETLPCPAYGLGGITSTNAAQLLETQACGIAGVEAIQRAFGN